MARAKYVEPTALLAEVTREGECRDMVVMATKTFSGLTRKMNGLDRRLHAQMTPGQ